jgi:hypothetical protein
MRELVLTEQSSTSEREALDTRKGRLKLPKCRQPSEYVGGTTYARTMGLPTGARG